MNHFDFNTLLNKIEPPKNWNEKDILKFLEGFTFGFKSLDEVYVALGDLCEVNVTERMVFACIVMRQLASEVETIRIGQCGFSASQQHRYQLKIDVLLNALKAKR